MVRRSQAQETHQHMATTKKDKNAPAEAGTALERRGPSSLAERPAWLKDGDVRGTENIGINDVKPPSLKLAQSMSPETKRHEAGYIDGLREGEFFNTVTKEIYGEGPINLVIVQSLGHRHIEFAPRDEGGGVLDFDVKDGDPRTQFTTKEVDGKEVRVKPRATKYYDYLVLVTHDGRESELMSLSFKSTQLKKAIALNTILAGLKMPSFAVQFTATAVPEKKGKDNFYGWKLDLAGYVPEAVYFEAEKCFEQFKDKNIIVSRDGEAPDDAGDPASDVPF